MKRWWILKGLKIAFFVALMILVMGFVVMTLWNWLMPGLFSLSAITFWQALGVLVLAKILFGFGKGGWGYHGGHYGHWKHKGMYWKEQMEEKLKNMTPEDREKFREEWRKRCGWKYHQDFSEEKKSDSDVTTN